MPRRLTSCLALALGLLITAGGCSSAQPRPAARPALPPPQAAPPAPLGNLPLPGPLSPTVPNLAGFPVLAFPTVGGMPPLPPSLGGLAVFVNQGAEKAKGVACQLPSIPVGLGRALDCSASRRPSGTGKYQPRQVLPGTLPGEVDFRRLGISGPTKDQGAVGACSAFTLASILDTVHLRAGERVSASPQHLFSLYSSSGDLGSVNGRPVTTERMWPYQGRVACTFERRTNDGCGSAYNVQPNSWRTDPVSLAGYNRANLNGRRRILEIQAMDKTDLHQIVIALAQHHALFATFDINVTAWSDLRGAERMPSIGRGSAAHAVTLIGYRNGPQGLEFLIKNSWGQAWGRGGHLWVPAPTFRAQIRDVYHLVTG